jgi:hypothetical protein
VNELQAGIEPSFAVFPQSSILFQPSEGAFDRPAFWDYSEGVESITLDDLEGSIQGLLYAISKGLISPNVKCGKPLARNTKN